MALNVFSCGDCSRAILKGMKWTHRKEYIVEFVYGGIDGAITTFAIVSGAIGASLSPAIILILGFANLFADGFSMGVSNYLSSKSQQDLALNHFHKHTDAKPPLVSALVTFSSFVFVGFIPLLSFVLAPFSSVIDENKFFLSAILTGCAFLIVGAIKGDIVESSRLRSALLTLVLGGIAASIAFFVGFFVRQMIGF